MLKTQLPLLKQILLPAMREMLPLLPGPLVTDTTDPLFQDTLKSLTPFPDTLETATLFPDPLEAEILLLDPQNAEPRLPVPLVPVQWFWSPCFHGN